MKHTQEEILKALQIIKDTCNDETIDCDNCPFGDDEDLCRLKFTIPANWKINKEDNVWRAFNDVD